MSKVFEVTILGVNSAIPVHGRHPSCQIVNFDHDFFMIDCGEGSQVRLTQCKIKRNKINHIFISHLHGDHCYGLPGLITSFSLGGRTNSLTVHGPVGVKNFILGVLESTEAYLSYELIVTEYDSSASHCITISDSFSVSAFPMKHRVPTLGYRFNEKISELNIDPESINKYELSIDEIIAIKNGEDIERAGKLIQNSKLTLPPGRPRSYAYCSDTVYDLDLIPYLTGSDLLYHETTYLDDLQHLAGERMHSTLGQAIDIAKRSDVPRLITGHYSSRYLDLQVFLDEGLPMFPGLLLGQEGCTYSVRNSDK